MMLRHTVFSANKIFNKILNISPLKRKFSSEMNHLTKNSLVWIDLEMTGLNENTDHIMEIACIITDHDLDVTAVGPNVVIHHNESILASMDDWCKRNHNKTGLTEACRKSSISLEEAENTVLRFISSHVPQGQCCMAGNTIYMDRLFIKKHMPKIHDYLHYRLVDVSSIAELCKLWNPVVFRNCPAKKRIHRSLSDIEESIEQLRYYKKHFFKEQS